MNRIAYLVAFLKPDMTVGGVGIFSEEKPSCTQAGALATIYASPPMRDYGEAKEEVLHYVRQCHPWLLPHLAREQQAPPPKYIYDVGHRPGRTP